MWYLPFTLITSFFFSLVFDSPFALRFALTNSSALFLCKLMAPLPSLATKRPIKILNSSQNEPSSFYLVRVLRRRIQCKHDIIRCQMDGSCSDGIRNLSPRELLIVGKLILANKLLTHIVDLEQGWTFFWLRDVLQREALAPMRDQSLTFYYFLESLSYTPPPLLSILHIPFFCMGGVNRVINHYGKRQPNNVCFLIYEFSEQFFIVIAL